TARGGRRCPRRPGHRPARATGRGRGGCPRPAGARDGSATRIPGGGVHGGSASWGSLRWVEGRVISRDRAHSFVVYTRLLPKSFSARSQPQHGGRDREVDDQPGGVAERGDEGVGEQIGRAHV